LGWKKNTDVPKFDFIDFLLSQHHLLATKNLLSKSTKKFPRNSIQAKRTEKFIAKGQDQVHFHKIIAAFLLKFKRKIKLCRFFWHFGF
jgi:hypothetical protein